MPVTVACYSAPFVYRSHLNVQNILCIYILTREVIFQMKGLSETRENYRRKRVAAFVASDANEAPNKYVCVRVCVCMGWVGARTTTFDDYSERFRKRRRTTTTDGNNSRSQSNFGSSFVESQSKIDDGPDVVIYLCARCTVCFRTSEKASQMGVCNLVG